jgi:membrane protease YdiL (CAAX protease family)
MVTKTKGVITYILFSFGMAWVLWEIPLRLGLSPRSPLFQVAILPGAFAPAAACIVVRKWVTREGFEDAGLALHLSRWRYYLVAWFLPLPVVALIVALAMVTGIGRPDWTLQRALQALAPTGAEVPDTLPSALFAIMPFQLIVTALLATPVLWGEEFGWRGYLQVRLLADRPLLAAVATGLIWGAWHYPINLRGYNFPGHPIAGLAVFPVTTVLLSIIFGWLRLRTGSVWTASLAHAATNAIGGSLTLLLFLGGPDTILVGYTGMLSWIPLGGLCAWIILSRQMWTAPGT